jgi:hypothetical protein
MKKAPSFLLLAVGLLLLGNCQNRPSTTEQPDAAAASTAPADTVAAASLGTTADQARAAVAAYVQALPNAALYQLDSARVMEAGPQWQVMVPRTDWARRMPNKAAFNVDKQTGAVSTQAVK